ncbi:hypothetical protein HDU96_008289 [Phlyctochytrium bullatum]|nr:hypothetical protein HDU96_008289 [Phlyctochytrium bullatum]
MSLKIIPIEGAKATSGEGFIYGHPGLRHKPVQIQGIVQLLFPTSRVPKIESLAIHFEGQVTFPTAASSSTASTPSTPISPPHSSTLPAFNDKHVLQSRSSSLGATPHADTGTSSPPTEAKKVVAGEAKDEPAVDSYELVALKRTLIDLQVPVKLSDMLLPPPTLSSGSSAHGLSTKTSTSSLNGNDQQPPAQTPPVAPPRRFLHHFRSLSSVSTETDVEHGSTHSLASSSATSGSGRLSVVEIRFRLDLTADEAADLPPSAFIKEYLRNGTHQSHHHHHHHHPQALSKAERLGVQYHLRAVARFAGTFENTEAVEKIPLIWPKFHPDAVSRVVGTGVRRVKRSGVTADGFRWRWEILSGVASLGDMRPLALFIEPTTADGKIRRGNATVTVTLIQATEWKHLENTKRERRIDLGTYVEDNPGDFNDKIVTFALPRSLHLQPTLDYDPVHITHRFVVHVTAPVLADDDDKKDAAGSAEPTPTVPQSSSSSTTAIPFPTASSPVALDVRTEIPYAIAGFTRDEVDDLVADAGNLPEELLSEIPASLIGKRLEDMDYIKFSAETLRRIVKEPVVPLLDSPAVSESARSPWHTFQNVMVALKRYKK